MSDYYSEQLFAERLRKCYEIAPPRARQYLEAEIDHVAGRIRPGESVLELGRGYGHVLAWRGLFMEALPDAENVGRPPPAVRAACAQPRAAGPHEQSGLE